jgi:hypothetical protein
VFESHSRNQISRKEYVVKQTLEQRMKDLAAYIQECLTLRVLSEEQVKELAAAKEQLHRAAAMIQGNDLL